MTESLLTETATAPGTSDTTGLWTTVSTPDGPFTVVTDSAATVLASGWTDEPDYLMALVHRDLRPTDLRGPAEVRRSGALRAITDAVEAFYAGQLDAPGAVTVSQRGGAFLQRSWDALRSIPAGTVVTYSELAQRAGEPAAIRAAASSCARNAAALFVPCHRVMRRDGTLGGFRYGLEIKRSLQEREATPVAG